MPTNSAAFPRTMPAEKPQTPRPPDARRSNKPIMEKRRRARINQCLNELKCLILEALRKDPSRHSKLEKADILEMTVKHLQNVQRHQMAMAMTSDPTVVTKFRSGFSECAAEATRYVNRIEGVDAGVRQRLVAHLANCVAGLTGLATPLATSTTALATAFNVTVPPYSLNDENMTAARLLSGLSLIPGRLLGGDFALLLPAQSSSLNGLFSPAAATTPTATITTCDDRPDVPVRSGLKSSAFTAVVRPTGPLSPASTAGSCTSSGSSVFSPPPREASSPDRSARSPGVTDCVNGGASDDADAGPGTSGDTETRPPASAAETERMWRPW